MSTSRALAVRDPAFAPMLATLGTPPPASDGQAVEVKFDGQRGTLILADGRVTVFSRNGLDVSSCFPELSRVAAAVGDRPMVLDGEIVAVDDHGRPSFTHLQRRWPQQRRPSAQLLREVPVRMLAFDIIQLDGHDLTGTAYGQRRELLDTVMVVDKSPVLTVPRAMLGVAPADALQACAAHGLEGIVTKRLDSPYTPGERSPHWRKIPYRASAELLVAGYWCASGPGGRSCVGSLLVAGHDAAGDLVACGQVGTGFSDSTRRRLYAQLHPTRRATSPVSNPIEVPGVRWVEPRLVVEVAYREYVEGRWLRHPSFKGERAVEPAEVRLPVCT
ncbi:non-homologous end-joining DNA ligase [Mycobacterium avium subsp. hominissuis]|uniref:non-homologous end-joining DNA ligase n=1 Tax=Mycobacterium avium TaxID=1764 RepID=UPI002666D5FF|nr:non-homologous end-joining DNA ligase [Mycobacterium avium]MDO2394848.1 non-homologous end-joining DNA ligase [Mycobacterium avium subsp. hominissuis]